MISLSLLSGLSFWQLVWREGRWATASNTGRGLPPEGRLGKPGYEKIGRRTAAPGLQNRIFLRGGDVCTQTRKWLLLCFSLCRADLRFPVFKQGQPWPATQLICLPGTGRVDRLRGCSLSVWVLSVSCISKVNFSGLLWLPLQIYDHLVHIFCDETSWRSYILRYI